MVERGVPYQYPWTFSNSINLISKKHDLTGIRIFDEFEESLFPFGLSLFFDPENESHHWVDTSDDLVRKNIQKSYKEKLEYFKDSFLKAGASVSNISTKDPYILKC